MMSLDIPDRRTGCPQLMDWLSPTAAQDSCGQFDPVPGSSFTFLLFGFCRTEGFILQRPALCLAARLVPETDSYSI